MNLIENQYAQYFSQLGYTVEFFEGRGLFYLKEISIYCKVCDDEPDHQTIKKAIEASKKNIIVLLNGSLSFKTYPVYQNGEAACDATFVCLDSKYSPLFYEYNYNIEYWEEEAAIIAKIISNKDFECRICGCVNDIRMKHNVHYQVFCKCGNFITNCTSNKPMEIHFGKYKGRLVKSMSTDEEVRYMQWALESGLFKGRLKEAIEERVMSL